MKTPSEIYPPFKVDVPMTDDETAFEDIEDDYEEYLDSPDKEIHTKAVSKKVIDLAFDNQKSYSPFDKILSNRNFFKIINL